MDWFKRWIQLQAPPFSLESSMLAGTWGNLLAPQNHLGLKSFFIADSPLSLQCHTFSNSEMNGPSSVCSTVQPVQLLALATNLTPRTGELPEAGLKAGLQGLSDFTAISTSLDREIFSC
jgi:hypothetical protein